MAGDGADTIFARASGAGKAGVAVIRISGPQALEHARAIAGRGLKARRPFLRTFRDSGGAVIDTGLVVLFPGPQSFTGEDVAELHAHGSRAVEQGLADALCALGARPAQAGEFTRRALLNGKLDLAEAEGLADLIDAETDRQRKLALGQFGGRLSALAQGWRERLIEAAAPLEAAVDFPDEEDIPATVAAASTPAIGRLIEELEEFAQTAARARVIREGLTVAIIGAPNAGKSSLLNRLSGEDRAIVSDAPGTTRDVVSVRLDLGGALVTILDTAGLRDGVGDSVEQEGMRRTRLAAEGADVRIFLVDVSRETSFEAGVGAFGSMRRPGDLVVANKIDRGSAGAGYDLAVSALAGTGVADLAAALGRIAIERGGELDAGVTRTRHAEAVARALDALRRALERVEDAPELAAEDLRVAARALDGITGAIGADDLLDRIFSSFCIGK